jgi:DNA-binding NarL/FixJ family response regulator
MTAIRLLIVDDHPIMRDGLRGVFGGDEDFEVVGEAGDTDRDVLPAIQAGATGYLLKDAPRDELIRAVRAAHQGQSVLAPTVASTLVGLAGNRSPDSKLSPREVEVLKLAAEGATNQVAARKLLVSQTTIKTHLLHIYTKLGVRDRASAVATGYQRGLLG